MTFTRRVPSYTYKPSKNPTGVGNLMQLNMVEAVRFELTDRANDRLFSRQVQ